MDLATLIGVVAGLGLIAGAIMSDGSLMAFFNAPGLLIVIGGTLSATLVNQPFGRVLKAFSVAKNAIFYTTTPVPELVETIQQIVQTSRKEGLLGLEKLEINDRLLKRGCDMAIDGMPGEMIASTLKRELGAIQGRHQQGQQTFKFMAKTAPAMGMVGTLVGLVNMLRALDNPSSIGPAMAIALLTTFYGAVMAFLIFGPISEKLEARTREEVLVGSLTIAGIEAAVEGDNMATLQSKLDAFLAPKERELLQKKKA